MRMSVMANRAPRTLPTIAPVFLRCTCCESDELGDEETGIEVSEVEVARGITEEASVGD